MHTILVMAELTLREAVRRKIVLAALILGILFLVVFDLGFYFIGREIRGEMAQEMNASGMAMASRVEAEAYNFLLLAGMYVVNFLGIATAALLTADSLAGEIATGTVQAVVTKPIRRAEVVLGKWLGHAVLLLGYLLLVGGGVMLSLLIMGGYHAPNWMAGLGLIYLNSLIIMSLTLAFSSSFSTLATGGAVFGAYGVAFIGGWVERIGAALNNQTAMDLGIFSSLVLPSEALWNKAAYVMSSSLSSLVGQTPFTSASQPSTAMLAYSGLYLLALMGLAIWRFRQRDL